MSAHFKRILECVPIPARMELLERDKRGLPIPFIVLRDASNVPHFTVNDQHKVDLCRRRKLCGICGKPFETFHDSRGRPNPHPENAGMTFVGGPMSALHKNGAYIDPPMHHECATFALRVCPYLAVKNYDTRMDDRLAKKAAMIEGQVILKDPTMIPDRPEYFVAVTASDYRIVNHRGYMKPLNMIRLSWWRHGERVPFKEAKPLLERFLNEVANMESGQ